MNKLKTKTIRVILIAMLLLGVILSGCSARDNEEDIKNPEDIASVATEEIIIPVTVQEVQLQPLEKKIILGGLLKPQEEVTLTGGGAGSKIVHIPVAVGTKVSKGQIIIVQDMTELEIQQENLEINRLQLQENYDKTLALKEAGAAPESQVTALENQLKQLDLQLESLQLTRDKMTVSSTISGIVSALPVVEGQLVSAQTPVATIVNIDKLLLDLEVGEKYIQGVHNGDKLEVLIPALNQEMVSGVVKAVPPNVNPRTKAFTVTVEVNNPKQAIKGGMYSEVALVVERRDQVIAVPQFAIVKRNDQEVVYVVEDDQAAQRIVKTGIALGDVVEITEGLQEGDQLIIEGQYGVGIGAKVQIVNQTAPEVAVVQEAN